jgi:hypothetical protein
MKSILYISTKDKVRKGAQKGKSNLISCSGYLVVIDLVLVASLSFNKKVVSVCDRGVVIVSVHVDTGVHIAVGKQDDVAD